MTSEATAKRRCYRRLSQLLAEDVEEIEALRRCLEAIGAALGREDESELRERLGVQAMLVDCLEARREERLVLVSAMGFPPTPRGVIKAIRWCDADGELLSLWTRVTRELDRCMRHNRHALALLRHGQERVDEALARLLEGERSLPRRPDPGGLADPAAGP